MSEGELKRKLIFCNRCDTDTHHDLRESYPFRVRDEKTPRKHTASIWTCAGCEQVTFEIIGRGDKQGVYFPKREWESISQALFPKVFRKLKFRLKRLYEEVIACFNNDCLLLCTMGLRALLEGICADKGLRDGNLAHKIDGLNKFFSNPKLIKSLHHFRFAGNAAAHGKFETLESHEARKAIDVMEGLLDALYGLDDKASQLKYAKKRTRQWKAYEAIKFGSVQ